MMRVARKQSQWRQTLSKAMIFGTFIMAPMMANADEGGVSFWVPGFFGSLAAAPLVPGFSFASIYYHSSLSAGSNVAFARQVTAGNLQTNFTSNLDLDLKAKADLLFLIPTYTFAKHFLCGQANFGLAIPTGQVKAHVNATLSGSFGLGPGFVIGGSRTDRVSGLADIAPMFNLRWNYGVHNIMTYLTGNVPVGAYNARRIANLGINHNTLDVGGGYTYFNTKNGGEFSTVLGFTYNFPNTTTHYRNGTDLHFDTSASMFFAKQTQIGLIGYGYQQLTCDSGSGNRVGCFKSRIFGVGPQFGYIFPGTHQNVYINLKVYDEFGTKNRAQGWNLWLTLAISPALPSDKKSGLA